MGEAMERLTEPDNLAAGYQVYRADATAAARLAAARERMAAGQSGQAAPAAAPTPAETQQAPAKVEAPTGAAGKVAAVAMDIAGGIVEAPVQAVGGVSDAVHWAFTGLDHLAGWLDRHVADLTLPGTGVESIDRPLTAIAGKANEVAPATTVTGGLIRATTEFLTGFLPGLKAAKAVGLTGAAAGMAAGAAADFSVFDPQAERLSNLWQRLGLPANVLTDYLAADPADSEIEGRVKNALEGAGLGVLAEGVGRAAKLVQATLAARRAAAPARSGTAAEGVAGPGAAGSAPGAVNERDFLILGDPNAPLLRQVEPAAATTAAEKLRAAEQATAGRPTPEAVSGQSKADIGGPAIEINFARIAAPEDVRAVIGQMTEMFAGDVNAARRGVQSHEATQALADDLGLTVGDLLARRKGQPLNAEAALAARRLWAASAEKLLETARQAAGANAGPVDQFNFRKMMAIHYAIQAEVIGARTETARALNAWAIPAGGGTEKARAIQQLMDNAGGPEVSQAMAQRLAALAASGADAATLSQAMRKGAFATTMDAVREIWVNGLLSSPTTHIVNSTSNVITMFQQVYERAAAARIGQAAGRGAGEGVAPGEAAAMIYGLITGIKDAFRLGAKAIASGEGTALGKIDLPARRAVSSEAFNMASDTALGRTVDFIGNVFRVPGRLMAGEDEFFKSLGYRMELHAQAFRTASAEGLEGPAMGRRVAEIVANPPENVRLAAADAALYNTFNNRPGWFGESLLRARGAGGGMNPTFLVLPFLRTPLNIVRYAFERSPVAPLVGQWRTDIAAGGARRDLALARMATGSAIMLAALDYAQQGVVSGRGPKDAGQREALLRQGWQPYSIHVNGKWFSYNRTDPFGMTVGFAADLSNYLASGNVDPEDMDQWKEILAGGIAVVANATVSKTYMNGLANFVQMMDDPTRYSESYANDLLASFVPFAAGVGALKRASDPTQRETNSLMDQVTSRLPGLAERLTPKRDLWGQELKHGAEVYGRTFDVLSPVKVAAVKESPIDAELARQGLGVERVAKKTSFDGVDVNFREFPEAYDAYTRLAGNELKHPAWGLGLKDYLDAVVSGKHEMSQAYRMGSDGPDGGKAAFVRNAVSEYRALAQQAIMADPKFAKFRGYVERMRERKMQKQMPVLDGGAALQ